jgi:two-component system, NtrC family, nitrogen regulation sensor histidine kinase NtrY
LKKFIDNLLATKIYLLVLSVIFFIASQLSLGVFNKFNTPSKVAYQVEQHLHQNEIDAEHILKDSISKNVTSINLFAYAKKPYGLFIFDESNNLLAWNSNKFFIDKSIGNLPEGSNIATYQNGTFEAIKHQKTIGKSTYTYIAIIPIYWNYFIENKYLSAHFEGFENELKNYKISDTILSTNSVKNIAGKPLASISLKSNTKVFNLNYLTILYGFLSIVFLMMYLNFISLLIKNKQGLLWAILFLLISFLSFRILSYNFHFPFPFDKLEIFDPSIYASDFIHPSLGDFIINSILFYWLLQFYKKHRNQNIVIDSIVNTRIVQFFSIAILFLAALKISDSLRSLVQDSKISFDVNNLMSFSVYSVISLVFISFLCIIFFAIAQIIFATLNKLQTSFSVQIVVLSTIVLLYLAVAFLFNSLNLYHTSVHIGWLCLFGYLFQTNRFKKLIIHSNNIVLPFFWIIYFAATAAVVITFYNATLELEQRKKIAEKIYFQTDITGENLLNIATNNFTNSFFINNKSRLINEQSSKFLKDSIVAQNFSGYLNKYQTNIYLFSPLGNPIFNIDSTSVNTFEMLLAQQDNIKVDDGLYTITNSLKANSYCFKKQIIDNEKVAFLLYIIIKPKNYKNESIFPELFRQSQEFSFQSKYDYAIYDSGKLATIVGNSNFGNTVKPIAIVSFKYKTTKKVSYLIYQPTKTKTIIIVKDNIFILELITFFGYLFFCCVILVFCFKAIVFIGTHKLKSPIILKQNSISIGNQIQLAIIFFSVFSFVIIAVFSILFFINKFNISQEQKLAKSIKSITNSLQNFIPSISKSNQENTFAALQNKLIEVPETQNLDINFFDKEGSLVYSTQPYIYNKQLLSNKINASALFALHKNPHALCQQKETIGNLQYASIYSPINNEENDVIGFINIPLFNSQTELNSEISGFLATLINLNALIFLFAGTISILIADRITASIKLVGNKMKNLQLDAPNEEIYWNKNDEIGLLIKEYNKMVKKLEISAIAFAKAEREGAWKEMAQQVAHEIKNPLTPMKLSIQYLQKSIEADHPNVKQISQHVATTLIEQINQLANIASDFSQFANITNVKPVKYSIVESVESVTNLYSVDNSVAISIKKTGDNFLIFADKIQMNRLFTNLIKNAIEASAKNNIAKIDIEIIQVANTIKVSIIDFGSGIQQTDTAKIFTPNFTTKTSGTGLGLAICKGIVEHIGGNIGFNSMPNGTQFYIVVPMV